MKVDPNDELVALAPRVTWKPTGVSLLKEELLDQYSPLVRMIEIHLAEKSAEKKLLLPELRKDGNESVAIFSDYGGEHASSRYRTYSFLVCAWNHSYYAFDSMRELRNESDCNSSSKVGQSGALS